MESQETKVFLVLLDSLVESVRRVNVVLLVNKVTGVKMVIRDHGDLQDHKVLSALMVVEVPREDRVFLDRRVKRELVVILATLVQSFKDFLVKSVMRENVDPQAHRA